MCRDSPRWQKRGKWRLDITEAGMFQIHSLLLSEAARFSCVARKIEKEHFSAHCPTSWSWSWVPQNAKASYEGREASFPKNRAPSGLWGPEQASHANDGATEGFQRVWKVKFGSLITIRTGIHESNKKILFLIINF